MTILVVGGLNGFVGSNTSEALGNLGRKCVVTRHKSQQSFSSPAVAISHAIAHTSDADHSKRESHSNSDTHQETYHEDCDYDDRTTHSNDNDCGVAHKRAKK